MGPVRLYKLLVKAELENSQKSSKKKKKSCKSFPDLIFFSFIGAQGGEISAVSPLKTRPCLVS